MKRATRLPLGLTSFVVRRPSGWFLVIPLESVFSLLGMVPYTAKARPKARPATTRRKGARHVA